MDPLLRVDHLTTVFDLPSGRVPAVNDVSFEIRQGETLGIVGGRMTFARPGGSHVDLAAAKAHTMREIRGAETPTWDRSSMARFRASARLVFS